MEEYKEKLVVFDKYDNAVDANIVKGALEASGVPAGVIGDSTANAVWMAPIMVVVFKRDLEQAIRAIYDGEMKFEDYSDEMSREEFDNLQLCNRTFAEIALKCHPELTPDSGKAYRDVLAMAKDALAAGKLDALNKILAQLP